MKKSDWISVNDRLPKLGVYVLVCRERDGERWVQIAASVKSEVLGRMWYDTEGWDIGNVTHWMKIVLPYSNSK